MAPLRRKKGNSQSPSNVSGSPVRTPRTSPMKSASARTPMKSPLRQTRSGGITKAQKLAIIENLNLESVLYPCQALGDGKLILTTVTERSRKLRAQYTMQARSLKQRIEMRINRVPKKLWGVKIGELLVQSTSNSKDSKAILSKMGAGGVKGFVEDVRRLSQEGSEPNTQAARLVIPKKRTTKKIVGSSARDKMPPPPLPGNAPIPSPAKNRLPPSSSPPARSSSPARPAPAKKAEGRAARKVVPSGGSVVSISTRPSSRATTRSSLETAVTSSGSGHENPGAKGTKSSQAKAKTAITANTGLKRGGVKGNPSSGSLKENRVAGVREKPADSKTTKKEATAATGGRVLRSRK